MEQNETAEGIWIKFAEYCIHKDVSEDMREAFKMCFFGGMTAALSITSTVQELKIIHELHNYQARLLAGKDWIGIQGVVR